MKKVMVFGTFDNIHEGHRFFLREAKKYGDYLLVVIARDVTVFSVKGRKPLYDETKRFEEMKKEKTVDSVVLGNIGDVYRVVKEHAPDVICFGYDQKEFVAGLQEKLTSFGLLNVRTCILPSFKPEIYKSSLLNKKD